MSVYQALGNQQNCNIDYKDYKEGYCYWGYDLTPDQGASYNKSSAKRGIIRPWQVKRCSTKTGSCIIQCFGYKLYVELQKKKKKKKITIKNKKKKIKKKNKKNFIGAELC